MQLVPRYLVNNRIEIISNDAGFITEYRPVYSRQLQVYRGIDNVLQFKVLNADQKPIDISAYTPKFQAFDENNMLVIEHDGSLDSSASTTGLFTITITDNDTLNLKQQYLSYGIHLVDGNGDASITYSDVAFNNKGTIKLSNDAYPGPAETISIDTINSIGNSEWASSTVDAQPAINGNEALHTAVIYSSNYIGDVVVQGTLDNQVTNGNNWADIATVTFTGNETEPKPVNFNGVFSHLRFKTTADPANKITKILVRN